LKQFGIGQKPWQKSFNIKMQKTVMSNSGYYSNPLLPLWYFQSGALSPDDLSNVRIHSLLAA
jgi:hypothetical protein